MTQSYQFNELIAGLQPSRVFVNDFIENQVELRCL